MNRVAEKILSAVQSSYRPDRDWSDGHVRERLASLAEWLGRYGEAELTAFWERFPHQYTFTQYPTVGDFARVMKGIHQEYAIRKTHEAADDYRNRVNRDTVENRQYVEPSPEAKARIAQKVANWKAGLHRRNPSAA